MYILLHANSLFLSNCMLTDSLFHTEGTHISCRSLCQSNPPYRLNQWNIQTKFNIFLNRFVSKKGPVLFRSYKTYVYSSFVFRPSGTRNSKMFRLHWNDNKFVFMLYCNQNREIITHYIKSLYLLLPTKCRIYISEIPKVYHNQKD